MRSPFTGLNPFSASRRVGGGGAALDPDVQAFITAAGITDGDEIAALDWLVRTRKTEGVTEGVWAKDLSIVPLRGGSASTCAWQLKRLQPVTFYGGWTFSATGAKPNGTNAYAGMGFSPVSIGSAESFGGGMYRRTSLAADAFDFGMHNTPASGSFFFGNYNGNTQVYVGGYLSAGLISPGYMSANMTEGYLRLSDKGVTVKTAPKVASLQDTEIVFGARGRGINGADYFSANEYSLVNVCMGFTEAEEAISAAIFEEYMSRLNISVL